MESNFRAVGGEGWLLNGIHTFLVQICRRYPFHERASYTPDVSVQSGDPLGAYLTQMDQHGVDRAVLVHPEPYGDDHRLVLDCLNQEKERVKGTCLFYPRDPDAPRKMEELVSQQPRIIATRFHAHRGKNMYLDSLTSPEVRADLGEGIRPKSDC